MRYICTHTDFDSSIFQNGIIISANKLHNQYDLPIIYADNDLNPLQYNYAEGYMIYDIWQKDNKSEFIEINHYRRHFKTINTPDEIILPVPLACNMIIQYAQCHNINDLLQIFNIIDNYFPKYSMNYKNIEMLFPCNMFKLPHEDFNKYCEFVFSVLEIYNNIMKFKSNNDVEMRMASHFAPQLIKYQSRLQGYLFERIGTIFFLNYFRNKKINFQNIICMSDKIETKN